MIAHQLDLFGGPLKPPKKIKVDDEIPVDDVPAAESPVLEMTVAEAEAVETISPAIDFDETVSDEPPVFSNEPIAENGVEWEHPGKEAVEEIEIGTDAPDDEIEITETVSQVIESEPQGEEAFTDEAIFTGNYDETDAGDAHAKAGEEFSDDETALDETLTEPVEVEETEQAAELAPASRPRKLGEDDDGLNIPPDEELFKRQYYSMRETSAMFNVNQSLLRFWENEFDILQPKKNKKGDRYFRPADIKNLVMIHHLLRVRKFTLDGAKDYLNSNKKAADSFELVRRLEKLKSFLFELKAGL